MFEKTKPQLEQILELVALCPEKLQERCFELLLTAYLDSVKPRQMARETLAPKAEPAAGANPAQTPNSGNGIPDQIKTRFLSLAQRAKVSPDRAASLFDFELDPFNYHALAIPGSSTKQKLTNVALMLSLKTYLQTTNWQADWKEFRAMCLDHGCWDQANAGSYLKSDLFKAGAGASGIALAPAGIKAAEALLATLAGAEGEAG
ncbi:hypothetical protein EA658_04155 [Pseudoxanthomonas winnipegensis]|jgi:hypothetical protein|uniref:Uncharacterized protein n=1 Tax=Pseudoxanthomonas winnipegensis TaxID=2480810 RepID=A0ABY1WJH1_9GAMM|nr:hypothetical protein [Pseudoxanthomonas winnipegensis]TAA09844.1 hypothetical protein EA659_09760 [Pseudoxanthomonas winnipegensis]TAA22776.1 hypothetical protein EA658_04155 [Pseudoxanthomonas winnipegensis]TAH73188.1 hypothetical protein EA657_05695 [Pseudoxanthomonas winnipegensis]